MPLLDIAIAQSSFQNYLGYPRVHQFINGKGPINSSPQYEERLASLRKSFQNPGSMNLNLGHCTKLRPEVLIKAVATLEPNCPVQSEDGEKEDNMLPSTGELVSSTVDIESLNGDPDQIDEREKLRRLRISKANKGNTPWNKGRKHSPETLQRIRERTKLAMQNPKVKMKLLNLGHAQSRETREKIGVGVRMGWEKRRQKLLLQETCLFDWQNLIAEAARKGFQDEEELQWDSYKILNGQLQQEWLESIEYRKTMPRPKGSKRAPKSLEQRKKIAEAIAAKWADPEYRAKVCSGLAKYHGIPEGAERKVRKKSSDGVQSTRTSKKKVGVAEISAANEVKVTIQRPKLKKTNGPKYRDPLANSKLEMLKSIRAQRVASETNKNEALERAKLLIAEAENAAKALEVSAAKSPVAQASLIETRKLIAEAIQSIRSIEKGGLTSQDDVASVHQNGAENDKATSMEDSNRPHQKGVNGIVSLQLIERYNLNPNPYSELKIEDEVKHSSHQLPTSLSDFDIPKLDLASFIEKSDTRDLMRRHQPEPNGAVRVNGVSPPNRAYSELHEERITKRWVRGRLVEVVEGE